MVLSLLVACTLASLDVGPHTGNASTDEVVPIDSGGDTADSADTDTDTDTDPPPIDYDCAALPEPVLTELDGPRAHHDVAFDAAGGLVGSDTQSLLTSQYDGSVAVLVAGGVYEGVDRLPGGDFIATDGLNGALVRITPEGATTNVATGLTNVYGLTIGPDGNAYVGNVYRDRGAEIAKVDLTTGEVTTWIKLKRGETPRMITFNLDSTVAFLATVGRGRVFRVPVGADLMPSGDAEVFVENVGGTWMDGIGMDACGNLYVAEYTTHLLYRITEGGTVTAIGRNRANQYGHGLEWGSGLGGWRADAIYQPEPYDRDGVKEVVVGVPSATTVRTWN